MEIINVKKETHDVTTITFKGTQRMSFNPGHFVMVQLLKNGKELPKRAYSISSSPVNNETIDITVKRVHDGLISNILNEVEVGEKAIVDGPFGHLIFDPTESKEIILLAAGCGIAPFRSFIKYIYDEKLDTKITLVYSNKTQGDIIFYNELKELSEKMNNFDLLLTLTREEKPGFSCGRIDNQMVKGIISSNKNAQYFICGSRGMANNSKKILEENGVPKEKIRVEAYG